MKQKKRNKDGDELRDKVFSVLAALDEDQAARILSVLFAAARLASMQNELYSPKGRLLS